MIIEDAKCYNKPLWILLQDLSKTYDQVDLNVLRLSMKRIKILNFCINFILDFFIHWKNTVFIAKEVTDYYQIKIGIDQSKIISPLLWYIYFNPLLCEIDVLNAGYRLTHHQINDVNSGFQSEISAQISFLSFMNDANWILDSQAYLKSILQLADEFYNITQAQINKFKSKLLTNTIKSSDPIPIKFRANTIELFLSTTPVHFLDVLIHIRLRWSPLKNDLKAHIKQFTNLLKNKPMIDKQFTYLNNVILLPQL